MKILNFKLSRSHLFGSLFLLGALVATGMIGTQPSATGAISPKGVKCSTLERALVSKFRRRGLKAVRVRSKKFSPRTPVVDPSVKNSQIAIHPELRTTMTLTNAEGDLEKFEIVCSAPGTTPDPELIRLLSESTAGDPVKRNGFYYGSIEPVFGGSVMNVASGRYVIRSRDYIRPGLQSPEYEIDRAIESIAREVLGADPAALTIDDWLARQ